MGTKLSLHTAALYDRGGMRKIGELLDLSRIKWERVRDEVSHATVWIEAPTIECGKVLGLAAAGRHELVIFRNDDRVWEGPITRIAYTKNGVEIEARDITHYLNRTIIRSGYDNTYPATEPVLDRLNTIMQAELARKEALDPPINVLPHLMLFKTADDARTAASTQPYEMTLYEHLETYAARGGIDYVVVGRSLILFDYDTPLGQTAMVTDSDFLNDPVITEYGMELATYSAITDGFGNYGATPDVVDPYYGEWEILDTAYDETVQAGLENPNITVAEMQSQATRVLAGRNPTPVVVRVPDNSTLNPCGNLTISNLVPGVWVPLTAELPGRTLTQMQKLDSMRVEETDRGEQIKVVLGPNNGESGEIVVWDGEIIINPDYVWDVELGEWVIVPGSGELVEVYLGGTKIDPMWWTLWTPSPVPPEPTECDNVNLISNPYPQSTGGWTSLPTPSSPASVDDYYVTLHGGDPVAQSSYWAGYTNSLTRSVTPTLGGTSGIPVTPGTAYVVGVDWLYNEPTPTVYGALEVTWYDGAGAEVSSEITAESAGVAIDSAGEESGIWFYANEPNEAIAWSTEGRPSAVFVAPEGAAFARPKLHIRYDTTFNEHLVRGLNVADFHFGEACNLIPNPEPTPVGAFNEVGYATADGSTWECDAYAPNLRIYEGAGYEGANAYRVGGWTNQQDPFLMVPDSSGGMSSPFLPRVFFVDVGMEIGVTAGAAYAVAAHMAWPDYYDDPGTCVVGIRWYDADGLLTGESTSPEIPFTVVTGWDETNGPRWGADPGALFTAPASAAFGRPYLTVTEYNHTWNGEIRFFISSASMVAV